MKKMVMAGALAMLVTTLWTVPSAASFLTLSEQVFGHSKAAGKPVILAQSADPEMRIQQLEEQVRQLNGRIEEMSFQLLQMQETLRKTQEDNEFRFQELEKSKKSGALEQPSGTQDTAEASGEQPPEASQGRNQPAEPESNNIAEQPLDQAENQTPDQQEVGTSSQDLGSITFDANGHIVDNQDAPDTNQDVAALPPAANTTPDTAEQSIDEPAAAQSQASQDDTYQSAYDTILAGDYANAERQFRAYIAVNPQGKKVADASFWLGEAQYSQGKYSDSAKTFLNSYKAYGNSAKAPDMLLKLAMSLAALDSKDTACATLRQVIKAYPKASRAILTKVSTEQKRLSC